MLTQSSEEIKLLNSKIVYLEKMIKQILDELQSLRSHNMNSGQW